MDYCFQANAKAIMSTRTEINPWSTGRMLALWENYGFLNVINLLHRLAEPEINDRNRATDMSLFGHL